MAFNKRVCISSQPLEGWTNVQFDYHNPLEVLEKTFKKCSVSEVFVNQVLEYLPEYYMEKALTDWRRILMLGGSFTIVFTDPVRASFLYARKALSHEQLRIIMIGSGLRNALSRQFLDDYLAINLNYGNIVELPSHVNVNNKKIWQVILAAKKS